MNELQRPIITVPFSKVLNFDISVVGQKGYNLGSLLALKVPVPNGFVVTSFAYNQHFLVNQLSEFIKKELTFVDPSDSIKIESVSTRIRRGILKFNLGDDLASEIVRAYSAVSGFSDTYVAVRSSSPLEELKLDSFTGEHSTFLNVRGKEDVLEKVKYCWASLFSPKNIFYSLNRGIDISTMKMAVVVQKMVQAEASGILFTVNPIDNNPTKMSIDAVLGLGEVLANGQINPDTYLIDKESNEVIEKHIVPQDWMLVRKGRSKKGEDPNVRVTVGEVWKARQKIDNKHINKLIRIGKAIEQSFKTPQEVEWTYEGGKVWVVQSRTMSSLLAEDPDLWKKTPTVEALKAKVQDVHNTQPEIKVESVTAVQPESVSPLAAYNKENIVLLNGKGVIDGVVSAPVKKISSIDDLKSSDKGVIVIVRTFPDHMENWVNQIVGLIVDDLPFDARILERISSMGVPCIANTQIAMQMLKDGELITINGTTGDISSGAVNEGLLAAEKFTDREKPELQKVEEDSNPPKPKQKIEKIKVIPRKVIKTATKIYVNLSDPDTAQTVATQRVNGVCILDSGKIVSRLGIHPTMVLKDKGRKEQYVDALSVQLYRFGRMFEPSPVIYALADLTSDQYRKLEGGMNTEAEEVNPLLGLHGINRMITNNEEPKLELDALRIVRNKENIRNISLALPFVRTYSELREMKHLVAGAGFRRSSSFKLYILVDVPSAVIRIEKLLSIGIDGVIINSDLLSQTLLSYDKDNPRVQGDYRVDHPAVMWSLERVIRASNKYKVQSLVTGGILQDGKNVSELVEYGVSALSTSITEVDRLRQDVVSAERRLITSKK